MKIISSKQLKEFETEEVREWRSQLEIGDSVILARVESAFSDQGKFLHCNTILNLYREVVGRGYDQACLKAINKPLLIDHKMTCRLCGDNSETGCNTQYSLVIGKTTLHTECYGFREFHLLHPPNGEAARALGIYKPKAMVYYKKKEAK